MSNDIVRLSRRIKFMTVDWLLLVTKGYVKLAKY